MPPFGGAAPLPPAAPPALADLVTLAFIDSKVFLRLEGSYFVSKISQTRTASSFFYLNSCVLAIIIDKFVKTFIFFVIS